MMLGGCGGSLITKYYVLTALHCAPSQTSEWVSVRISRESSLLLLCTVISVVLGTNCSFWGRQYYKFNRIQIQSIQSV